MTQNDIQCKICGAPVTRFIKSTKKWWDWCSNKCMGVDPEILAKKAKTNLAKFGSHPMRNISCRQKLKDVVFEKYGVDNPSRNEEVKAKMRETFINHYGVDNPSKDPKIVQKIRDNAISRFSDKESKDEILTKRRTTFLENFGVETNKHFHITAENLAKLNDTNWLIDQHTQQRKSLYEIADELGISPTPISYRLHQAGIKVARYNMSTPEKELYDFLTTITTNILQSDRNVLAPKELDFYLPERNLAIEINGVYWHSECSGKDKKYHLDKTQKCEEKGIHLLHIYDIEWDNKQAIIKSKIMHLLGLSKKTAARKCKIKEVSAADAAAFLNITHIQGICPSKLNVGLFYEEQLVAVASFGKSRFNKKYEWELLRYSNALNTTVVGGMSKIINYFTKKYNPISMISYADRRWSSALSNIYKSIGFEFQGTTSPNYKYFQLSKDNIVLYSRNKFQKHKLNEELKIFDKNLTEYQNMLNNGYQRIWDCGNLIYTWQRDKNGISRAR